MPQKQKKYLHLERHKFREIMLEARDLLDKAEVFEYNLMHEQSLELYDIWSPYVLDRIPTHVVNSPGYKIAFLQAMSIVMLINAQNEKKSLHGKPNIEEKKEINSNVIDFLKYKEKQ